MRCARHKIGATLKALIRPLGVQRRADSDVLDDAGAACDGALDRAEGGRPAGVATRFPPPIALNHVDFCVISGEHRSSGGSG